MGIYKRKQELYQEIDQENKKKRNQELDQGSDQENKKKDKKTRTQPKKASSWFLLFCFFL